MPQTPPSTTQMRAFKIGARARKFALEGCVIEGYELLLTALAESKETEDALYGLLQTEMEKYEKRVALLEEME